MDRFTIAAVQQVKEALNTIYTGEVHLTGSRHFHTSNPNSDWDFVVQYQPRIDGPNATEPMVEFGFVQTSAGTYKGQPTVWKHKYLPIHVIETIDIALYLRVRDTIATCELLVIAMKRDKEFASEVWRKMLAAAR